MVKTPIEKAKYIEENFRKYIKNTNSLASEVYGPLLESEIDKQQLLKGPYISKSLDFKPGKTLEELTKELDDYGKPLVNPEMLKLGIDDDQKKKIGYKLRFHQETAIRQIHKGHNLIVTTGTGSGKTESFLYPIINEILNDPEIDKPGIRAIFLFPMNALVNDQFDRVRSLLGNYKRIKYGYYTGDTKVGAKREETEGTGTEVEFNDQPDIELQNNEMVTREDIRNNPPHILFTNYSMLEYLLIRPTDDSLLNEANTKHWKFIVLDEAHIYKGALAIEVGMLLRRLQTRINKKIQFILTSATLGAEDEDGIKKIKEFGKGLTSKDFNTEDILFSKRIPLDESNATITIEEKDYIDIYDNFNETKVSEMLKKYGIESDENDLNAMLFDLIYHDSNLYLINSYIQNEAVPFTNLQSYMKNYNIGSLALANFIDLICKCMKNGRKLMDLKYHSFIRSLSGAYVTLGDNPELTLEKYKKSDDGKTFFEIGSCKHCNTTYLIGVVRKDSSGKEKLYQNGSVDIYVDYQEGEDINVDFFITEDEMNRQAVEISDKLTKYELCPICGQLVLADDENKEAFSCSHTEQRIVVYKAEKTSEIKKNNLCTCPCCRSTNKKGLISTINMGRDASTALVTQIFFEALDPDIDSKVEVVDEIDWDNFIGDTEKTKVEDFKKQILAFSDSRQQASHAVVFAENNHHRLLRKRIIVKALEDNSYKALKYPELLTSLKTMIEKEDLFDTNTPNDKNETVEPTKQAEISILFEILKVDGIYGGEGLGLYYFDYDLSKFQNLTNSDAKLNSVLSSVLGKKLPVDISSEQFYAIVNVIINVFRMTPAVYSSDSLTVDDRKKYFRFRQYQNGIKYTHQKEEDAKYNSYRGLVSKNPDPKKNRITKLEKYVMAILKVSKDDCDLVVEAIWKLFTKEQLDLTFNNDKEENSYQIKSNMFSLHHFTDSKWYYCQKCKKLTRLNVNSVCPNCIENNSLVEINPDEQLKDNIYRYQYLHKKIEKLVYKEHTGQISNITGKARQELFKAGKINYLSSSTTFEMGIDIGSLENVLMRNVPPSPSNYIQRAGRAGRGKSNSAFVVTYCSSNSHDYTFFLKPNDMINGVCHTPIFKMENAKVITRHLLATAFSRFFLANPNYYCTVGEFYDNKILDCFVNWLKQKDTSLIQETNIILSTTTANDLENGKWIDRLFDQTFSVNNNFELAKTKYEDVINDINKSRSENNGEIIDERIRKYKSDYNLIGNLVDSGLLPKYGFPTDVVEMKIRGKDTAKKSTYKLSRDMKIAISEYAPESEIMVDKTVYVSRYINRVSDLFADTYYACECQNCHKVIIHNNRVAQEDCKFCNHSNDFRGVIPYLKPRYGFIADKRETNEDTLPKKTYSSPIKYVGNGHNDGPSIKFSNAIEISAFKDDELLIINENPFYTCPLCGYTKIFRDGLMDPERKFEHNALSMSKVKCDCKDLYRKNLGYLYKTDVLKIHFSSTLGSYNAAITTLYAFLEGISIAFDIERTDIDGIYVRDNLMDTFVLFDTVPGGAGHVKRLLNEKEFKEALNEALEIVKRKCCDTACYKCLKNYYNQTFHNHLDKRLSVRLIERLIEIINHPTETQDKLNIFDGNIDTTIDNIYKKFDLVGECLEDSAYDEKELITDYLKNNSIKCLEYSNNPKIKVNDDEYDGLFFFKDFKILVVYDIDEKIKNLVNSTTDYKIVDIKDGAGICISAICEAIGG
ncbi:MAG: DEAD/DEAH box helicase [Acholeplasmatales bacterium]|nr:DEAD/DEAH box helicase [Acholeplasmatales bacterium]